MKKIVLILLLSTSIINSQKSNENYSLFIESNQSQFINIKSISLLAIKANSLTSDKKEQLDILLHWTLKNMTGDENRFFYGNEPITIEKAIENGKGLCEDYTNIFNQYCSNIGIQSIRIDGYVKPIGFKKDEVFDQANHTWNAVKINNNWYLCDLFWATTKLNFENTFENEINLEYYISNGENFISTHLPCDPIFQLLENPIKIEAFTNLENGFNDNFIKNDTVDYNLEIENILKLKKQDCQLQIARNTYQFNKSNPNFLIEELYNCGVQIFNNPKSKSNELLKAKKYFSEAITLIDLSKREHVLSLKPNCINAINIINKVLK